LCGMPGDAGGAVPERVLAAILPCGIRLGQRSSNGTECKGPGVLSVDEARMTLAASLRQGDGVRGVAIGHQWARSVKIHSSTQQAKVRSREARKKAARYPPSLLADSESTRPLER
jgi:hypothetical protein